jgi:peptidoglycan/xylan/chitin deacetylase (PgdA/CDA1 family)
MNYLRHIIRSKGTLHALNRAFMIYKRFGFTRKKSREALQRIHDITAKHGCTPSFFITAELLDKHSDLIKEIAVNGTHMGLHGHHHIDYCLMSGAAQREDIARGSEKFRKLGIPVSGFRAPFLRSNDETSKAVTDNGINWVSHSTMLFDGNGCIMDQGKHGTVSHLLGAFYFARSQKEEPSLPNWGVHCLEIPVALPDDEFLVDRLGIHDPNELTSIWLEMLAASRQHGELFNFMFHPERIFLVAQPLNTLLEKAISQGDVWVCSLEEISSWWRDRSTFSFQFMENHHNDYRIAVQGDTKGSLAVQHPGGELEFLSPESNGTYTLRSHVRPVIGVTDRCSEQDLHFLRNEGFILDSREPPGRCAYALDGGSARNSRQLLESINQAKGPLLRFWRWPNRYKSALAITADIDAITIWDFFRRARHFYKIKSR